MKKIFFLSSFVFLFGNNAMQIIDEIKKIEQFRPKFKIVKNFDIFSFDDEEKKGKINKDFNFVLKKSPILRIYAIFQDKVNINGEWFKIGDSVNGYEIIKIDKNFVLLKKGNTKKYLKIISNSKIKFN